MRQTFLLAMLLSLAGLGCASPVKYHLSDRSCISSNINQRFGQSLSTATCPRMVIYPNGISLDREIGEEEAVLLALWNNAAFLELLADMGMAQGDLVQAGLLPNPEMVYFWPVTDKPFKYLFDFPLEAIWLRPLRVAAAEREVKRVSQRLTQAGLDLIRDTRLAYADVLLAQGRLQVAQDAVKIRTHIADLAKIRLDAGDISPQEASTALIDSHRALQDATRAQFDVSLAEERLRNFMGVPNNRVALQLQNVKLQFPEQLDADSMASEATQCRPDALAAAQFSAAAAERVRLSRISWIRFLGILDATSGRNTGHEFGPAARFTLPIFNRNQGAIGRAEAELEKAERQRLTVNNQIMLDVHQAHWRFAQAQAELRILNTRVLPEVETAIERTNRAYEQGNTPYVIVLQTTQQLIDSRFREVQLVTDTRRAWSDLERSVGRHLADVSVAATASPKPLALPQDAPVETNQ